MTAREFPLVVIKRADYGPKARAARIVCARCGETDDVVVADRGLGAWIEKKFAAAGWSIGATDRRDFCPGCAGSVRRVNKETDEMAKAPTLNVGSPPVPAARSEDARKARLDVDLMLVDNFDPTKGRYREGWDDERVAREAGMSVDFVAKRREAEHGPLREAIDPAKLSALAAEFSALELALRGKLDEVVRQVQEASVRLGTIRGEINQTIATHAAVLRKLVGEK